MAAEALAAEAERVMGALQTDPPTRDVLETLRGSERRIRGYVAEIRRMSSCSRREEDDEDDDDDESDSSVEMSETHASEAAVAAAAGGGEGEERERLLLALAERDATIRKMVSALRALQLDLGLMLPVTSSSFPNPQQHQQQQL